MKQSLTYYITLLVIKLKGIKKNFSKELINIDKIRKEDVKFAPLTLAIESRLNEYFVLNSRITEISSATKSEKLILFFPGGAFISGPAKHHWDAIQKISKQTNHTIWMCDYPKAPENKISKISENIDLIYNTAIEKYQPNQISFIGDSAGGTLAISLIQRLIKKNIKLPNKIILVSPVMDASMSNPEIEKIEAIDPMLSKTGVLSAKKMCAENKNLKDIMISPLYGSFEKFPQTSLFLAENDITYPDQKLAVKKLINAKVDIKVVVGKNMPHIWPLLPVMKEAKGALNEIIRTLNNKNNPLKKQIIIGLLLIFQYQVAISQSDSLKFGLKGKIIRSLAKTPTSPDIFYVGLKGKNLGSAKIYKSEDSGKIWTPLNYGKPISPYVSDIQAISIANDETNSIYAGTWKDGLFKSVDNGQTWKKVIKVPVSDIRSIQTGIQTPLLVYASTSSFGVIKSIDGGETWKRNHPKTIDSTFKFAWSIELDEKNDSIVFAQTFTNGVWKSTDQGDSWKQILDTKDKVSWDMKISKNSKSIWVASSKSGDSISSVYHSENQGKTWEEINNVPQIGVSQINVIERNDEEIIIIGSWQDGIYVLKNQKWKKVEQVDFNVISEIILNDDELLIGSWGNGIYNIKL